MNDVTPPKFGMGAPVRRKEDKALITGAGRFTDDYRPEGTLHAVVLRSTVAHAGIRLGDLVAARAVEGVRLVLTAEDLGGIGGLPCTASPKDADGSPALLPHHPLLAGDIVRHVGEPIAFIVAETEEAARSAAEAIEVDYHSFAVVTEVRKALEPDAPLVWPDRPGNVAFVDTRGNREAADAAFAMAKRISRIEIVNNRVVANYIETRAVVAEYDAASGRYTITLGTQGGHGVRDLIANDILHIDPKLIRVITPDVGGGFGTKAFLYHEYPLAMIAAKRLGCPVKWTGDRSEHFVVDSHGRDNFTVAEMAMDADGRFLGMRVDTAANIGAYVSEYAPFVPVGGASMLPGVYDIPAMHALIRGVYTNTVPVDAYRGAGRPEAAYVIERLVDLCGAETGLGPVEIRRRNFIAPSQMPYQTPTGRRYDSGEFDAHLTRALELADAEGFASRQVAARSLGLARGFGISTYIEACAFPGNEPATVTLNDDGSVTLFIGTQANGQGHATSYAQFIAGPLGLDYDRIELVQGDTDRVAQGEGTGGSRSIPIGVASVDRAAKALAEQVKKLAGDRLEAAVGDLEIADGGVRVVGTDRRVGLAELAQGARDKSLLTAVGDWQQTAPTFPNGTHIAEVEVDPQTGAVSLVGYVAVDDFGATVNPALLAGQVHGGVAQGAGQALVERTVYGEDGQLLTASFQDYSLPRAEDFPSFVLETRNVPATTNALGIKGAGEAGTIGAAPAVMNALLDALGVFGVRSFDMPATPEKVWSAIWSANRDRA